MSTCSAFCNVHSNVKTKSPSVAQNYTCSRLSELRSPTLEIRSVTYSFVHHIEISKFLTQSSHIVVQNFFVCKNKKKAYARFECYSPKRSVRNSHNAKVCIVIGINKTFAVAYVWIMLYLVLFASIHSANTLEFSQFLRCFHHPP